MVAVWFSTSWAINISTGNCWQILWNICKYDNGSSKRMHSYLLLNAYSSLFFISIMLGGRDTAGLGGKGGPYRLDAGHRVYQISQAEKDAVPEEVKRAAREMGEKAFKQR